jgi:hypothetical protein
LREVTTKLPDKAADCRFQGSPVLRVTSTP